MKERDLAQNRRAPKVRNSCFLEFSAFFPATPVFTEFDTAKRPL